MPERQMKLPLEKSFAWLCDYIGTLASGLMLLATGKEEVNAVVDFSIPASGWGTDNTVPSHSKYIDINVPGLTADDIVSVNVAPGSVAVARAANFTTTQSYAGKFRLRAESIPTESIAAQFHVTNTVAYALVDDDDEEEK